MHHRRRWAAVVMSCSLAWALAACGSNNHPESDGTTTTKSPVVVPFPAENNLTAFITSQEAGNITQLNLATRTFGPPKSLGSRPDAIAVTPNGQTMVVVQYGGSTVVPITTSTFQALAPITTGTSPGSVTITSDGTKALVANYGSGTLAIVNLVTGALTATIPVGGNPRSVAVTPDGTMAFVGDFGELNNAPPGHTVTPVNLVKGIADAPINLGAQPCAMAMAPDGHTVYVTTYKKVLESSQQPGQATTTSTTYSDISGSTSLGSIVPIDVRSLTVQTPIPIDGMPSGIRLSTSGETAYVVVDQANLKADGTLETLDLAKGMVMQRVVVGSDPWTVALTPDGKTAWVVNSTDNSISPVNLLDGKADPALPIPGHPHGIVIVAN